MAESLSCEIVTPVKTVFTSEATMVGLPGEAGSFGVMQRHEPLVSALVPGKVSVAVPGEGKGASVTFLVSGGYTQVTGDKVIVLANDAVSIEEINAAAVKEELAKVEKALSGLAEGDSSAAYYKAQKGWFELQLKAVSA